ncbi:ankyrin-like protein, partial [Genlisea aurea]
MPCKLFPLRWESTGDRWWFASPIDWAAANGHYVLVKELLHIDTNLLIKLTSLPRTRRLETVWDDESSFNEVAKCRSVVARKLLHDSDTKKRYISLIRAGYGGWLLYTAAAAGDLDFVKELLERDPLLVFGEGEYGVTDILYAAARSKNSGVFKFLFDYSSSLSPATVEESSVFRLEMINRAVHAAARGGGLEILIQLLEEYGGDDPSGYRDAKGSTLLHSAAGRGQVQIVKHLISSYSNIVTAVDSRGSTALHVAAYFGQLPVIKLLLSASPSSASAVNDDGDTFVHAAISGFGSTDFRRLDRQIELIEELVGWISFGELINVRNKDGRTPLHLAVVNNIRGDIIDLIMTVPSVSLEIRDSDGKTPLDLLRQRPQSVVSYEILMKLLMSSSSSAAAAGGVSSPSDAAATWDEETKNAIVSDMRSHGMGTSPGTSFRIPDAEIFLYTG